MGVETIHAAAGVNDMYNREPCYKFDPLGERGQTPSRVKENHST